MVGGWYVDSGADDGPMTSRWGVRLRRKMGPSVMGLPFRLAHSQRGHVKLEAVAPIASVAFRKWN